MTKLSKIAEIISGHPFRAKISNESNGDTLKWTRGVVPKWKITAMRKQWGSCSPKGVVSLNPNLVKAPRDCIDYVLVHELAHLKEHNHSKRFYGLLDRNMPDWKSRKAKLDGIADLLINE